jgi:hypothetical protein
MFKFHKSLTIKLVDKKIQLLSFRPSAMGFQGLALGGGLWKNAYLSFQKRFNTLYLVPVA